MPDIDIDFDERRRGDVIRYVTEKYGDDRVAQIVTYGTIKAKQAIKDAARVLGYPYALGDRITKAMPPAVMGKDIPLGGIFDPKHKRYAEAGEFRALYESDAGRQAGRRHRPGPGEPQAAVGRARGRRDHVQRAAARRRSRSAPRAGRRDHHAVRLPDAARRSACSRWTSSACATSRSSTTPAQHRGQPRRAIDLELEHWTSTTPATYELLARGDTLGVFQLDGGPMRALLRLMQPDNFEDISAVLALYRPGPMGANAHNDYADRKNGRSRSCRSTPSWPSRWPRSSATPTA